MEGFNMLRQANSLNTNKLIINKNENLNTGVRILSDVTKFDIEKSYNFENINGAEAYYSNRYGWTLRKTVD